MKVAPPAAAGTPRSSRVTANISGDLYSDELDQVATNRGRLHVTNRAD